MNDFLRTITFLILAVGFLISARVIHVRGEFTIGQIWPTTPVTREEEPTTFRIVVIMVTALGFGLLLAAIVTALT